MAPAFLAHGTWLDDLAIPLVVVAVFAAGVLRASAGVPEAGGVCPYCGAPREERLVGTPLGAEDPAAQAARCGRCGFRLGARLSPSETVSAVPGEASR